MKTMRKALGILFVVFIFAGLSGSFFLPKENVLQNERRSRAPFPIWEGSMRQYFHNMDRFAADNFPYREVFLDSYLFAINTVGDQVNANKAFRGKDDWLFLGNDYNESIDKLEGRLKPDPEKSALIKRIRDLAHAFEEKGVKVVFVLGVQKASVYPEKLPSIIKPSPHRYISTYLDWLRTNGVEVVDPTAALIERKSQDIVYWKHDTHWNYIGGSVAFKAVTDHFGIDNCPVADQFKPTPHYDGDLEKIGLFDKSRYDLEDHFMPQWSSPFQISEHIINDPPNIRRDHRTKITNNPQASRKESMWIVGDSFRDAIDYFSTRCFSSSYNFYVRGNHNEAILKTYDEVRSKPSYLVVVITERTF